ncbi:MAG: chromosome segregation protein SMC, partial [Bacteroidetes bacterium]
MQLQKLEIRGFKSFGDKITIHFDKGITGIVGPNGCGKSNVVDSIRWVLGEQSTKNLRSEKMENIIFNGTKNRKPLQMAEVSLTFDNTKNILPTEYSQVTITRRYYRAGEGEYLLNGVPCRLKDINNLFLDTGIGSDSYAIIELKMIDSILNDTDHSRSTLFEEAAGISKFKIRKKETLKKLEETDADLSRVDDLLFEINKNLRTLEKQAKQAQKYYQTKEEYKNFSVLLAQKTVKDQQNLLVNLDQKIQAEQDRKMAFSAQSDLKESENEAKKLDILNKEKSLIFGQKALNAHLDKIRQNESEKKLRSERLNFLNEKIQNLSNQILLEKQSTQGIEAVLQSLNQQKNNAEKQLADSEMSLETLKKSLSEQKIQTQNVQNQVDEFAKKIKSKEEQISQQQKKREIAKLQIASLRNEIEQNTTDSEQQKHKIKQFEQELTDLAEELNEKTAELEQIREEEEDLQAQIKSEKVKLEQERSFLVQINRQLDALQNEFELTKSLEESLEGFPEAIKFLKKQPDWYENIPLFSDILTCEDEYKVAIENYLKTYMDFYVVDLPEQALQAIRLLEKHDKGKANFFVLSELNKKFPKINKPEENQNMIWAMDIVEFDAKYNALMTFLLQNVFIAEDEWAKQQIFGAKQIVLAKNGGIIYGNHRISGGSVGIFEGKRIGRAKNLEKLTLKIDQLQTEITQCSERIILEQKNIENLKNHTQNDLILALQLEIGALKEKSSSLKSRKEELQKNIDLSQARLKAKEEQLQDLQDQLIDL